MFNQSAGVDGWLLDMLELWLFEVWLSHQRQRVRQWIKGNLTDICFFPPEDDGEPIEEETPV